MDATAAPTTTINDLTEAEFAAHLAAVAAVVPKPGRYAHRDRLGRFVRRVNVAAVETWINASDDTSHAHANCGNLKGMTHTEGAEATGWLCTACVVTNPPAWLAAANVAPSSGTAVCPCCNTEKSLRSFPTAMDDIWRIRDTSQCRKCRDARRAANRMAEAA